MDCTKYGLQAVTTPHHQTADLKFVSKFTTQNPSFEWTTNSHINVTGATSAANEKIL